MSYYRTCPRCGANLDPGETCGCGEENAAQKREREEEEHGSNRDSGQPGACPGKQRGDRAVSRRKNGTNRSAAALGLSMYGPMNTGKRKRPRGAADPAEALNKSVNDRIAENGVNCKWIRD